MPSRPERRGLSPLAATSLVLVVIVTAIVTWLAISGKVEHPPTEPAVVMQIETQIKIPPPLATPDPESASAKQPAKQPAKAPEKPKEASPAATATVTPAVTPAVTAKSEPPPAPKVASAPGKASPAKPRKAVLPATAVTGLRPAPDPLMIEKTSVGPLPRISPDGRKPWQTYGRPFDPNDRRPRIAIVVANLGLSGAATEAAIQRLPGAVTLAFAPYARGLPQWIALARAAGHEVLLDLPMEPINYPANDPGPHTLLTSLTRDQNMTRLHWLLGRVTGYVGVVNQMGSRFTTSDAHVRPVLKELDKRGLLFLDSRSSLRSIAAQVASEIGLPRAINNRFIDAEAARGPIDARLKELERIAKAAGFAVGIGTHYPVTIDRLVHWTATLKKKGFYLAPISALVNTQRN